MARNRKNSHKGFMYVGKPEPFTFMCKSLLETPAFRNMSHGAFKMYWILRSEYMGEITENRLGKSNTVICPYDYLIKQGFRRGSITRYLNELELFEVITVIQGTGGFENPSMYHFEEGFKNITEETAREYAQIAKDLKTRKAFEEYKAKQQMRLVHK